MILDGGRSHNFCYIPCPGTNEIVSIVRVCCINITTRLSSLKRRSHFMQTIEINAEMWATELDFVNALLAAIGAPEKHGSSVDAFVDSMIWGGVNALEPPYAIRIVGTSKLSKSLREFIELTKRALAEGRAEYQRRQGQDVDVSLEIDR